MQLLARYVQEAYIYNAKLKRAMLNNRDGKRICVSQICFLTAKTGQDTGFPNERTSQVLLTSPVDAKPLYALAARAS